MDPSRPGERASADVLAWPQLLLVEVILSLDVHAGFLVQPRRASQALRIDPQARPASAAIVQHAKAVLPVTRQRRLRTGFIPEPR
jgi:hypothetical protein